MVDDDDMPPAVVAHLDALRASDDPAVRASAVALEPLVRKGIAYSRHQAAGPKSRAAKYALRDVQMAAEFTKRRSNPHEDACDSDLMAHVGIFPRFNLKRSAAINAIKRGLAHHSLAPMIRASSPPGIVDQSRGNVTSEARRSAG